MSNIIEKIWKDHVVKQIDGHPAILAIDLMLMHEVTSAQAFKELEDRKLSIFDTSRIVATLDHSIPTRKNRLEFYDETALKQVNQLRANCKDKGVKLFDFDSGSQGIVHVIGPELGITQPGMTIVCGDSHTATHGAFGALAFGIGTTEVGHVLATSCILQSKPKSYSVVFKGKLPEGCSSKDVILNLIGQIGVSGGVDTVIEYCGESITAMSMEERMTICNMSIECGARAGLVSPDQTTISYLEERLSSKLGSRFNEAVEHWLSYKTSENATFDKYFECNLSELTPMVTWGVNPAQTISINGAVPYISEFKESEQESVRYALEYTGLHEGQAINEVPVSWAFIGSCTNGRIEDLRKAARVLRNQKVSNNVNLMIVPGSELVLKQAHAEGLVTIFEEAGATVRMPGCSMCLGMNDDKVPPGERCISTSNRNFVGRQGPGSITHLASPETVAASAISGKITSAL